MVEDLSGPWDEKLHLVAKKENLLIPDGPTALFFSPAVVLYNYYTQKPIT